MNRHRLWLATALCWFLALASLLPSRVAPVVHAYALAWSLFLLLSPAARALPPSVIGVPASGLFAAAATMAGWALDGVLLLSIGAILGSLLIATALGRCEDAFERAVRFTMSDGLIHERIDNAQSSLYVELRRARTYETPLSVLAISPAGVGDAELDRLVAEVVRNNVSSYLRARLANLLSHEMRDFDLLAARGDHFVSMLPQTPSAQAEQFVDRLRAAAREELGVELDIGLSSFPDDEVTLDALLERAESAMRNRGEAAAIPETAPRQSVDPWPA